jgi:histidine ammonia-lyase
LRAQFIKRLVGEFQWEAFCEFPFSPRFTLVGQNGMTPTHPAFRHTAILKPGAVDLALLRRIHAGGVALALDASVAEGMRAAQAAVQNIVDSDKVVYGINTGFGKLATTRIGNDHLAELQRNLVLSHSAGIGEPLAPAVVRLVLAT